MTDDWMDRAECRNHDANIFNGIPGRGTALHICRVHCRVKPQCRIWANERGGWIRQTVGGQWWISRRGHGTEPVTSRLDTDTVYCKTCNPYAQELPRPVDNDISECPACDRSVGLDKFGHVSWHLAPGHSRRSGGVCVGSGTKP